MYEEILILAKVAFAALLGGIIGAEREYTRKTAGMRTFMLVAAAACLLQSLSSIIISAGGHGTSTTAIQVDPTRIMHGIITGISFLGAGTIILHRKAGIVKGLTTAATVLLVAAVGVTVGLGKFVAAAGVTLGAMLVLVAAKRVEKAIAVRPSRKRSGETGVGDEESDAENGI